jgi:hypothetical protein
LKWHQDAKPRTKPDRDSTNGHHQIEGGAVWTPGPGARFVFIVLNGSPILA